MINYKVSNFKWLIDEKMIVAQAKLLILDNLCLDNKPWCEYLSPHECDQLDKIDKCRKTCTSCVPGTIWYDMYQGLIWGSVDKNDH